MAYVHLTDDYDPTVARVDADGKTWMWARALSSATVRMGHVLFQNYNTTSERGEWQATVPWDSTMASTSAAAQVQFYVGINNELVPSDNYGWFQIGGKATQTLDTAATSTAGSYLRWHDATCKMSGSNDIVSLGGLVNFYGMITDAADAATNHDVYLFGRRCNGLT